MSPVNVKNTGHFNLSPGTPPGAPTAVTSITKDAGATVSFLAPVSGGSSGITQYTVTPYIGATAQAPTTVATGSLTTLAGSNGNSYLQASVTGLTNSTAYTFTVKAHNAAGDSAESGKSGANTPLAGLVFGDDFNGVAGGAIDPEWWIYSRCGYIAQSEVEWYLPGQCVLDGAGNLNLIGTHTSHTGASYPSDGNTVRTQTWLSGSCQSNARTYQPAAGNTMTFESRFQVPTGVSGGMWPGLFWLEGQTYLNAWKTDPNQPGWDNAGQAEVDIAEFHPADNGTAYQNNTWGSASGDIFPVSPGIDFSAAMHVFTYKWKPGVSSTFFRDGTQTHTNSTQVAGTGCFFFMMLYLQILAGSATSPQNCYIDYVRVYDQNLG